MFCEKCGRMLSSDGTCAVCNATQQVDTYFNQDQPAEPWVETAQTRPTVDPGKGKGTAALVLGIVSLTMGTICSCVLSCIGGFIPMICAIIGIVLGCKAVNESRAAGFENKQAKTGRTLCIVALVIIVLFVIANAVLAGVLAASGIDYMEEFMYY